MWVVRARERNSLRERDAATVHDLDLEAVRVELRAHERARDVQAEDLVPEDVFAVLQAGGERHFVLVAAHADDCLAPGDVGRASRVVYMAMLERSRIEV